MKRALGLAIAAACMWTATGASAQMRMDVGPNTNPVYEKECGSCHFPYQPGWLPERSWRKVMGGLASHFGENATIKNHDAVLAYLVAGAADRVTNLRSRELMQAIKPNETPISITQVLYVGGIHGGFLDPAFEGKPQVKTLAHCSTCHNRAERGWFAAVNYTITDARFRSNEVDTSNNMPLPAFLRPSK